MAKTILNENDLLKYFWVEVVNIALCVLNYVLIKHILKKTPYEF